MNSHISMKLSHDKFRFHVSTIETENGNISIGGNNYRLNLDVAYIGSADFEKINNAIINFALQICESLHHKTIVPSENPNLLVTKTENQINIDKVSGQGHMSFPQSCILVCRISNTHIEDLCMYVGNTLIEKIKEKNNLEQSLKKIKVKVSQNIGPRVATMKFIIN